MSSLKDKTKLLCSGIIAFPVGDTIISGMIAMPCGMQHSVRVTPSGFQLPHRYQVYRERAKLLPCCYWQDITKSEDDLNQDQITNQEPSVPEIFEFIHIKAPSGTLPNINVTVSGEIQSIPNPDLDVVGGWAHESIPSFLVVPDTLHTVTINSNPSVPTKCQKAGAFNWHQGLDGSPPCNGAKTECPFYTGPKFKYINDENLAPGQPVMAQHIQELRYYIQDWNKFKNPQLKWEESFEEPYIWAKDFSDTPQDQRPSPNSEFANFEIYTILTRVYWDVSKNDAILNKYPSERSGSPVEGEDSEPVKTDRRSPPDFPSLVRNINLTDKSPVEIRFPLYKRQDDSENDFFIFESFEKLGNKIYIAGVSSPVVNLYVINKNYFSEFPNLNNLEITEEVNEALTSIVFDLTAKALTLDNLEGYRYCKSSQARFWSVENGIDLKPNQINEIYVLCNIAGEWKFDYTRVNYIFHHYDVVQQGFVSRLESPITQGLIPRIANIFPTESVKFDCINLCGDCVPSNAYHFYILDRTLTRFIRSSETPLNSRFWKVIKTEQLVEGKKLEGNLLWSKLDNCNKYLIEIIDPVLSSSIPAGLDRSWEPKEILFTVINQEPGTSSHGQQQTTTVEMKVSEDFGRSLIGYPLPVNFLIVEPKTDQDLNVPDPESIMSVFLDIFKAVDSSAEGEDILNDLLNDFSDNNSYTSGGVPVKNPSIEDELEISPHSISINDNLISVSNVSKYDLSYLVEFTSNITGRVLGKKWVHGIVEISNTWARDIDIYYSWRSTQSFSKLLPDYNKAIASIINGRETNKDSFGPSWYQYALDQTYINYKPKCGDHDASFGKPGPMFAPYEDCDYPKIEINDLGIIVDSRINYVSPIDEKYRGPDFQMPIIYKHNVFGTLFPKCWFEYSTGNFSRGQARWNGLARIRGPISLTATPVKYLKYLALGFRFPQFGNIGREKIRIFRSMHYREFIYTNESSGQPVTGLGWLPSFPFFGSPSLFDNKRPRTIIDHMSKQVSEEALIGLNLKDYQSVKDLTFRSTAGSEPLNIATSDTETFTYERKKFDDVYRIKKIRGKDGRGTRWPEMGFYNNFRSDKVVWAFSEPSLDLQRNMEEFNSDILSNSNFLSGVSLRNVSQFEEIFDKYSRPVFQGLEEKEYDLKIEDIIYLEDGTVDQYASIYIEPGLRLYFDRFTGEIFDKKNPTGDNLLNSVESVSDLTTYYETVGDLEPSIIPYFEHVNSSLSNSAPTAVSGLDMVDNLGNLYLSDSEIFIYPKEGLEGPLDDDEVEWSGFLPSIKVNSIYPKFLPKKELIYSHEYVDFIGINPKIKFSVYPSDIPSYREGLNGTFLEEGSVYVNFFTQEIPSPDHFEWKPYLNSDLTVTGSPFPDTRSGYIGPITVECSFTNPVEISHIEIAYEIYSMFDASEEATPPPTPVSPKIDPAFKIEVIGLDGVTSTILIDKPEQRLGKYLPLTFKRNFKFSFQDTESNSSPMNPIPARKIIITVGPRQNNTGFKLSQCLMKALKLNNEIEENILSIEPRLMLSTGLYTTSNNSDDRYWAQDPQRLTGTVSANDISDSLEYNGIAEFWRALNFDKENTITEGKLHKQYAGKFLTWDLDNSNPEVSFLDSTVGQSENRQALLIEEKILKTISEIFPFLKSEESTYFLSPFDVGYMQELGLSTVINNLQVKKILFNLDLFDIATAVLVSKGTQAPGWQDPGFYTCINPKTQIASCTNLGARQPMVSYVQDHGLCRGGQGGDNPGILHSLLDLFSINRPGSILGVDPVSPGFQQQFDPNSLSEIARQNSDKESILSRTEEYKKRNPRYKP